MQAVSGSGVIPARRPSTFVGNVIPYIGGEEDKRRARNAKIARQTRGRQNRDGLKFLVSAHCNRVMVEDGHTETVSVSLKSKATLDGHHGSVARVSFTCHRNATCLPPQSTLLWCGMKLDRPQPKFDLNTENGMATGRRAPSQNVPCCNLSTSRSAITRFAVPPAQRLLNA